MARVKSWQVPGRDGPRNLENNQYALFSIPCSDPSPGHFISVGGRTSSCAANARQMEGGMYLKRDVSHKFTEKNRVSGSVARSNLQGIRRQTDSCTVGILIRCFYDILRDSLFTFFKHAIVCSPYSDTVRNRRSAPWPHEPDAVRSLYTLRPAPCTLHPAPCTLRPAPCTLHPAPCTLPLKL